MLCRASRMAALLLCLSAVCPDMAAQAEKPLSASDVPQQLGPLLAKIDKPLVGENALKVRLS